MDPIFDAGNERLSAGKPFTLGLQHVLIMYAGVIAVPLIVRAVPALSAKDDAHNAGPAAEGGH